MSNPCPLGVPNAMHRVIILVTTHFRNKLNYLIIASENGNFDHEIEKKLNCFKGMKRVANLLVI